MHLQNTRFGGRKADRVGPSQHWAASACQNIQLLQGSHSAHLSTLGGCIYPKSNNGEGSALTQPTSIKSLFVQVSVAAFCLSGARVRTGSHVEHVEAFKGMSAYSVLNSCRKGHMKTIYSCRYCTATNCDEWWLRMQMDKATISWYYILELNHFYSLISFPSLLFLKILQSPKQAALAPSFRCWNWFSHQGAESRNSPAPRMQSLLCDKICTLTQNLWYPALPKRRWAFFLDRLWWPREEIMRPDIFKICLCCNWQSDFNRRLLKAAHQCIRRTAALILNSYPTTFPQKSIKPGNEAKLFGSTQTQKKEYVCMFCQSCPFYQESRDIWHFLEAPAQEGIKHFLFSIKRNLPSFVVLEEKKKK